MGSLIGNGFFNSYHTGLLFKGLVSYKDSNMGILRGSGKDYIVLIGNGFFNPYHTRLLFKGLVSYKDSNRAILMRYGKDYIVYI
ncbi:hypothetical protein DVH24_013430 [Malus domestica]|uniref:Uncharacterized protein n=1 Tax=Malus domestica TaxID=3750 RepID=A0A498HK35_MALDO|nr:hypothetical protein DVH24_013430 [Malus domestica]